ncbi:MAG: pyridoxamine 5'-phosphate oxidase family protein [Candidatus Saccharimonadales bacterium]
MDDKDRIHSVLQACVDMVISTADKEGTPWVTPVSYVFDDKNCLYWVSSKDSRHSLNIKERKEIAIVIYMYEPRRDAIYIEAEAEELSDKAAIEEAIKVRSLRPQPKQFEIKSIDEVTGAYPWRIYKATPKSIYVRESIIIKNQPVTIRRKIT